MRKQIDLKEMAFYEDYLRSLDEAEALKQEQIDVISMWDYNLRCEGNCILIDPIPFKWTPNIKTWKFALKGIDGHNVISISNSLVYDRKNKVYLCGNSFVAKFMVRIGFSLAEERYPYVNAKVS